jgi:hypothetical protein
MGFWMRCTSLLRLPAHFGIGTGPAPTVKRAFAYLVISPGSTYYLAYQHALLRGCFSHFAFFCFTFALRA